MVSADISEKNSDIKGPVKSIKIHYSTENSKNGEFPKTAISYSFSYDKDGNLTEKCRFDTDGNLFIKETYKYNATQGTISGETKTSGNTTRKSFSQRNDDSQITLFYDRNDQLIHKEILDFNPKGLIIKKAELWADDQIDYETTFEYDEYNRLTASSLYFGTGLLKERSAWTYNSLGLVDSYSIYNNDGQLHKKESYQYDSNGLVIYKETTRKRKLFKEKAYYRYETDSKGNWVKKETCKKPTSKRKTIELRSIEYYD